MSPVAVYVHVPFCPSKCGYCDFNSYAMTGEIMERTSRAIRAEILRSPWRGRPAKTIFFGGGTPTFLSEAQLLSIFEAVLEVHPPLEGAEITSEANPGTVDAEKFNAMRSAGFNRISLGAQSFFEDDLVALGRVHRSGEIERAVAAARKAGFENINLDLMFALPGQTARAWEQNLDRAISLQPEHLSLYCLTLEPNTAFYKRHLKNELVLPEDEAQVTMYETAVSRAAAAGYEQYEISNFAKPGLQCEHNLCYWRHEDYAGYGPGAVGCVTGAEFSALPDIRTAEHVSTLTPVAEAPRVRYTNLKHPERYSAAVEQDLPLWCEQEALTPEAERMERIMLGLRLNAGVPVEGLQLKHEAVHKLAERGWLEPLQDRLVLTEEGRHFCSEVALELL